MGDDHAWAAGFVTPRLQQIATWPSDEEFALRDVAHAAKVDQDTAGARAHWEQLPDEQSGEEIVTDLIESLLADITRPPEHWSPEGGALAEHDPSVGLDVHDIVAAFRPFLDPVYLEAHKKDQAEAEEASVLDAEEEVGMFTYSCASETQEEDALIAAAQHAEIGLPLVPVTGAESAFAAMWGAWLDTTCCEIRTLEGVPGLEAVEVMQPRVYTQHHNGLCGYYMLSNAVGFASALLAGPTSEVGRDILERLTSPVHFWKTYLVARSRLVSYVEAKGDEVWFPWEKEYILDIESSMERAHVEYLFTHLMTPRVAATLKGARIQMVYLSDVGLLLKGCYGVKRMQYLSSVFASFIQAPEGAIVICLGLATHWVTLAAVKSASHPLQIFLLNSLNTPVLDKTDAQLWEACLAAADRKMHREQKRYAHGRLLLYLQMKTDCRASVTMLAKLASGSLSVFSHWITGGMGRVLDSFATHCWDLGLPGTLPADPGHAVVVLESWLNSYFPPRQIENDLLPRLEALLDDSPDRAQCRAAVPSSTIDRFSAFYTSTLALAQDPVFHALSESSQTLTRFVETLTAFGPVYSSLQSLSSSSPSA